MCSFQSRVKSKVQSLFAFPLRLLKVAKLMKDVVNQERRLTSKETLKELQPIIEVEKVESSFTLSPVFICPSHVNK